MAKSLYLNLAVKDLSLSKQFFEKLGFSFNPKFTNDDAAGMEISDTIFAMLHTHKSFAQYTSKKITDPKTSSEVLIALQVDSKDEVDTLVNTAIENGGSTFRETADHGWMYERSFEDIDGHVWEAFWMDASKMPK